MKYSIETINTTDGVKYVVCSNGEILIHNKYYKSYKTAYAALCRFIAELETR